jgi:microcystin-dependent protein
MAQAFLGEIRCFGFNFAPYQWAQCSGQVIAISQNAALFSLLGTYYGGNGTSTFALPNLQGQVPMHWGTSPGLTPTSIGETQGVTGVTLTVQQTPAHTHTVTVASNPQGGDAERVPTPGPTSFIGPSANPDLLWVNPPNSPNAQFASNAISTYAGGGTPHQNQQPYLTLNFCIALFGTFPARN